jgi:cation-transporting ATPase 13A1
MSNLENPPDNGIVCYVLRTGFSSSQGELMRMIEFSQENVAGDKKEMFYQLLLLFVFALCASGYVLKKGLEDPERPTYKVLLRCILIITQVVPPSLPLQM